MLRAVSGSLMGAQLMLSISTLFRSIWLPIQSKNGTLKRTEPGTYS